MNTKLNQGAESTNS